MHAFPSPIHSDLCRTIRASFWAHHPIVSFRHSALDSQRHFGRAVQIPMDYQVAVETVQFSPETLALSPATTTTTVCQTGLQTRFTFECHNIAESRDSCNTHTWRNGHHTDTLNAQISGNWQRHTDNGAFRSGIGCLSDLTVVRCNRCRIDDNTTLTVSVRLILSD